MSQKDIENIFHANEELHAYSTEQLAEGITTLHFLAIDSPETNEYVVTPGSVFYKYLKKKGRKEVYVIP